VDFAVDILKSKDSIEPALDNRLNISVCVDRYIKYNSKCIKIAKLGADFKWITEASLIRY
jgi:hypothetical protein